jgi:TonB family protein
MSLRLSGMLLGGLRCGLSLFLILAPALAQPQTCPDLQQQYDRAVQDIARLQQALGEARQALAASPQQPTAAAAGGSAEDLFYAAQAYSSVKKYPEALRVLATAISLSPEDARLYRQRALVHAQLGHYPEAMADLSAAIVRAPKDAIAYNQRGIIAYARNDLPQARHDFSSAIELQPQLSEAYNNRGLVARKLGDYPQAIKDCTHAAQLGMTSALENLQVLQSEVRQAQERLRAAGVNPGPADGVPGQQTISALQQYQRAHGLSPTGLLDEPTRNALGLALTTPAATSGSTETPVHFLQQTPPEYPALARQQGLEGTVTLRLEMLTNGTVGQVEVAKSSGAPILDEAAQAAAHTWTHTPAMQNGVPVTRWVQLSLTFTLKDTKGPQVDERR